MVLIVVEAVPAGSKPPAADGSMRTSTGGKCGFGTSAPSLTRASLVHFSGAIKRGSAIMPTLVKLVRPSSTIIAEELSPLFTRSAAASSVRFRIFLYVATSIFVEGRGY